jgi:cyclohexa-1,5-dienecarbonyl-CoA hydratase
MADEGGPVRTEILEGGAVWRVVLNRPKANILDKEMTVALAAAIREAAEARDLKAVVLEGAGPHFCFGASVEEHLPESVAEMLAGFHGLFYAMAATNLPFLAAVRGQCLGGGLELAMFCHRVFASPDAKLGQPEIRLGVLPPVASVFLTERMGRGAAEDVCISGRSLDAQEAHAGGLVDVIADDPADAALAYAREQLLPHSAASLRHTVAAVRHGLNRHFRTELEAVERFYLDDLMATEDAKEGIRSFLEKRKPEWRNL